MPRQEVYESAVFRHFEDASDLSARGRPDNAAYLAGYVVECSFKLLVQCAEKIPAKALGHDLANLAGRALILATILSPGAERYRVDDPDIEYTLSRWNPEMRYSKSGAVGTAESHRMVGGGRACLEGIVHPLILDGVVELPT